MANFNKVILVGNLTRDPQLSYLPSQMAVVEFGLAVNRRWRSQDNQQREETCFVDCRSYGRQAETINQHLAKGRSVLVEGRLQYDTWEGKDGVKRSKHRVIIERFQFLGPAAPGRAPAGAAAAPEPAPSAETEAGNAPEAPPVDEQGADDIPF
jgi:single-strand DNA-binding protein